MTEHLGEASTPARIEPDPRHTVTDLLLTRVAQAPAHPAFRVRTGYGPTGETVTDVSTEDYRALVVAVAKGLLAAGVRAGDTIGIQGPTGYPWAVADLACLWVGAVEQAWRVRIHDQHVATSTCPYERRPSRRNHAARSRVRTRTVG